MTTRELVDGPAAGPHILRIDGQPPTAPVRYAGLCTCEWTTGYYHHEEFPGRLIDILQERHHTHRKIRSGTTY